MRERTIKYTSSKPVEVVLKKIKDGLDSSKRHKSEGMYGEVSGHKFHAYYSRKVWVRRRFVYKAFSRSDGRVYEEDGSTIVEIVFRKKKIDKSAVLLKTLVIGGIGLLITGFRFIPTTILLTFILFCILMLSDSMDYDATEFYDKFFGFCTK